MKHLPACLGQAAILITNVASSRSPSASRKALSTSCQFSLRSSGLIIGGSTEERVGFDRKIDARICQRLHRRAQVLWPELKGKLFDECWIGFRPATATGMPAMGLVQDTNVWLAYGHYRNGILLAPVTADAIAKLVLEDVLDSAIRPFGIERFAPARAAE